MHNERKVEQVFTPDSSVLIGIAQPRIVALHFVGRDDRTVCQFGISRMHEIEVREVHGIFHGALGRRIPEVLVDQENAVVGIAPGVRRP